MKYEEMSDAEINAKVAGHFLSCDYDICDGVVGLVGTQTWLGPDGEPDEREVKYAEFDPCKNASDAWSIIVENGISLSSPEECGCDGWLTTRWRPKYGERAIEAIHENPLRAAMICYLMIKDAEE